MGVLVGEKAPEFSAMAVMPDSSFQKINLTDFRGKYVVLFFYPLDFTFVCPTELVSLNENMEEFKKRSAEVFSISIDSIYSHFSWRNLPQEKGGISEVDYPMISDITKEISQAYDVLHQDGFSFRAVFIIDKEGMVRHQLVNDLPLGRNISEIIRTLDALEHFEKQGEVCPANWKKGKKAFKPNLEETSRFLSQ